MYPVYVLSKDRATTASTPRLLEAAGIPYFLVVEPQERESYLAHGYGGQVRTLPSDDQGVAYARNAVLLHARSRQDAWAWMLDDDITAFCRVQAGKCITASAGVLEEAEALFTGLPDIGLAALEFRQFAWCQTRPLVWNGYCNAVVCVHVEAVAGMGYREGIKEDQDFALQVLTSGLRTVRCAHLAFSTPGLGSHPGGLFTAYQQGKERDWAEALVARWGTDLCQVVTKPNGHVDAKINWRFFSLSSQARKQRVEVRS